MTPLLPHPDYYLWNLVVMTSPEAKRLWRKAIKEHWQCKCAYCGQQHNDASELTLDHVQPKSTGGEDLTSNLVPSCRRCNQQKGSNNWLTWMRETFGMQLDREELIHQWIQAT